MSFVCKAKLRIAGSVLLNSVLCTFEYIITPFEAFMSLLVA